MHGIRYPVIILAASMLCFPGAKSRGAVGPAGDPQRIAAPTVHAFSAVRSRVVDTDGRDRVDIRYVADAGAMRVFFSDSGAHYVFTRRVSAPPAEGRHDCKPAPERLRFETYRADFRLPHPVRPQLDEAHLLPGMVLRYSGRGGTRVEAGTELVYRGISPGADLVFTISAHGVKYDLRLAPGVDPSAIAIRWIGARELRRREDGGIDVVTPLGTITELPPESWQTPPGRSERLAIPSSMTLTGTTLTYRAERRDPALSTVIDPFVKWATYYGGSGDDYATGAGIDPAGNILVGGWTASTDFPSTPGALQTSTAGNVDAFVAKFRDDGTRVWATYLGGSDADYAIGLAMDTSGAVALTGLTGSTDFPVSAGAFQSALSGQDDAFVTVLNPDGTIRWSTYLGGTLADNGNGVAFDSRGNLVVTGRTISADFPVSFDAFQFSRSGNNFDAFIAKFTPDGRRAWATYLGGTGEDWGHSVAIGLGDAILAAGHTESGSSFPVTPDAQQGRPGGDRDGFFFVFSPAGARLYGTFIGGMLWDDAYGIAADARGGVVVAGGTGSADFPTTPGAYQKNRSGFYDAFIARYTIAGSMQWATYFGGSNSEDAYGVTAFPSGNVMLTGDTRSADFPTTPDAIQTVHSGTFADGFVVKLRSDGSPAWSTLLGGSDDENGPDFHALVPIASNILGTTVAAGWSRSADFPVSANGFQRSNGGGYDAYIVVLGCTVAAPPDVSVLGDTVFCDGGSVELDASPGFALYRWSTGDTTRTLTVTRSGEYSVTAIDSNDCGAVSRRVRVTVHPLPTPVVRPLGGTVVCDGDSVLLDAGPGYRSYAWSDGTGGRFAVVRASGSFTVTVTDTNGCSATSAAQDVVVNPKPIVNVSANGPRTFCDGGSVELDAGAGFATYRWSNGATARAITVTQSGTYSVVVTNAFGCSDTSADVRVTVHPLPRPVIAVSGDTTFCDGDSVLLDAGGPYVRYAWTNGSSARSVVVKQSGSYGVTVTDSNDCSADARPVLVTVNPLPVASIALSGPATFCDGDSLVLDAGGGFASYVWTTGETSRAIVAKRSAVYRVTVTSSSGCSAVSDSVLVTVHPTPLPVITPGGPLAFCDGDSVTLSAPGGYVQYRWSTGALVPAIVVRSSGSYVVSVTDSNGCSGTSGPIAVTVFPNPAVPVIRQSLDTLYATPAFRHQWNLNGMPLNGETDSILLIPRSGVYTVTVTTPDGCSATSLPLSVVVATATVDLPQITAAPGERVTIPLRLRSSEYLRLAGAGAFTATLRMSRSILQPLDSAGGWTEQGGDRLLTLRGQLGDSTGTLATFDMLAMLGDTDRTPLRIERFSWNAGVVVTTRVNGEFQLTICRDGGNRLYDGTRRLTLASHPNPFNATTRIAYTLIERGAFRLSVIDVLGRPVATIAAGIAEPGSYEAVFDAGTLASGIYRCVLETPGIIVTSPLHVVK